jgi:hypothetical protein
MTFEGLRKRLARLEARLAARWADVCPYSDPARALARALELLAAAWGRAGKIDGAAGARRDAAALRGLVDSGRADAAVQAECRRRLDRFAARMAELRRRGMA